MLTLTAHPTLCPGMEVTDGLTVPATRGRLVGGSSDTTTTCGNSHGASEEPRQRHVVIHQRRHRNEARRCRPTFAHLWMCVRYVLFALCEVNQQYLNVNLRPCNTRARPVRACSRSRAAFECVWQHCMSSQCTSMLHALHHCSCANSRSHTSSPSYIFVLASTQSKPKPPTSM